MKALAVKSGAAAPSFRLAQAGVVKAAAAAAARRTFMGALPWSGAPAVHRRIVAGILRCGPRGPRRGASGENEVAGVQRGQQRVLQRERVGAVVGGEDHVVGDVVVGAVLVDGDVVRRDLSGV